jgi:hypothetical protein
MALIAAECLSHGWSFYFADMKRILGITLSRTPEFHGDLETLRLLDVNIPPNQKYIHIATNKVHFSFSQSEGHLADLLHSDVLSGNNE